jgi:hypothetical protein
VLFDPSVSVTDPTVKTFVGRDRLAPAETKRVLDAVFGSRYLPGPDRCRGAATDLRGSRQSGDFAPSVSQAAIGAFTAPERSQTLYLIADGECGASHADNWGSMTLAVIEGGAVVARALIDGGSSLQRVVNIDSDGRSAVVLTSGFANQRSAVQSARLVRLHATGLAVVRDFGQVFNSSCGGGPGPATETYTIVHALAVPGAGVTFRLDTRAEPCAAP